MLLPCARRTENGIARLAHRKDRLLETRGQLLAGKLVEQRLVVERIEMTRPTLHEEEDDIFRAARTLRNLRCRVRQGARRTGKRMSGQRCQRDRAKSAAGRAKKLPARRGKIEVIAGHGGDGYCT